MIWVTLCTISLFFPNSGIGINGPRVGLDSVPNAMKSNKATDIVWCFMSIVECTGSFLSRLSVHSLNTQVKYFLALLEKHVSKKAFLHV